MASLASAIFNYYNKWEAKLLQYQEFKKKEEKFGKNDAKQRMSSGNQTAAINQVSNSASAVNEKTLFASEKSAQGEATWISEPFIAGIVCLNGQFT